MILRNPSVKGKGVIRKEKLGVKMPFCLKKIGTKMNSTNGGSTHFRIP